MWRIKVEELRVMDEGCLICIKKSSLLVIKVFTITEGCLQVPYFGSVVIIGPSGVRVSKQVITAKLAS